MSAYFLLKKSHVKGYTRKDGTQVSEHDDSRQAHPIGKHAAALKKYADEEHGQKKDDDYYHFVGAADDMKSPDHTVLKNTIRHSDTYQREAILAHIHPEHWESLGVGHINKDRAIKEFDKKHPLKKSHTLSVAYILRKGGK